MLTMDSSASPVTVWDPDTGTAQRPSQHPLHPIIASFWSPHIHSSSRQATLHVADRGIMLKCEPGHGSPICKAVEVSPTPRPSPGLITCSGPCPPPYPHLSRPPLTQPCPASSLLSYPGFLLILELRSSVLSQHFRTGFPSARGWSSESPRSQLKCSLLREASSNRVSVITQLLPW